MINILILITKSLDNQWIWLGENWCWTCQVFPLVINFSIVLQSTWCHLGGLIYWLITSLIEWLSDCPTNGLTDYIYWLTDGLTDWLTEWWTDLLGDWMTQWLTKWLTCWLTEGLPDLLIDWLSDWHTVDWQTGKLIDWLADLLCRLTGLLSCWLGDCVFDRLTNGLIDWLTDWLTYLPN